MPGVVAFVGADDVPGENKVGLGGADAEIFASQKVEYRFQPLGLIIAETPSLAERAAKLVHVEYSHPKVLVTLASFPMEAKDARSSLHGSDGSHTSDGRSI